MMSGQQPWFWIGFGFKSWLPCFSDLRQVSYLHWPSSCRLGITVLYPMGLLRHLNGIMYLRAQKMARIYQASIKSSILCPFSVLQKSLFKAIQIVCGTQVTTTFSARHMHSSEVGSVLALGLQCSYWHCHLGASSPLRICSESYFRLDCVISPWLPAFL